MDFAVRDGGGFLDHHHAADELRNVIDVRPRNLEILDRAQGVHTVVGVGGNL